MPRMKIPMHRYALTLPLAALYLAAPAAKPALAAADDEITITVVGDTGYSRNGQPVELSFKAIVDEISSDSESE